MIKIAFLVPNLKSGGSERMVSRLSTAFCKNADIDIVLFDGKLVDYSYGGKLVDLKSGYNKNYLLNRLNIIKRVFRWNYFLLRNRYDIVFAFSPCANKVLRFSLPLRRTSMYASCRDFGDLKEQYKELNILIKKNFRILFNSYALRDYYLTMYPSDGKNTVVIQNFFACQSIIDRSKENLSDNETDFFNKHITILSVSHFSSKKGQYNLLKSFELLKAQMPKIGLVFVGYRGDIEKEIHEMADRSKYSKDILFIGFSSNPYKYMSKSDVFVLPSVFEGFPNVLVEAMICGTPVIATDCKTGPREILCEKYEIKDAIQEIEFSDYGVLTPLMPENPDYDYDKTEDSHLHFMNAVKMILSDEVLKKDYAERAKIRGYEFDISQLLEKYERLMGISEVYAN